MNIGYIYKITNNINGKCYIGQTSKTIEERWRGHVNASKREERSECNYPLYKAFRKYGIENFTIEELERCEINDLNDREIYWIDFYDSYKNGYNQDFGGGGKHTLELDEAEVVNKYNELQKITEVAEYFGCADSSIRHVLNKHNIKIKTMQEHAIENGNIVYQLNDEREVVNIYHTLTDAGRAMIELGLTTTNYHDVHAMIKTAILGGWKACGYYWESPAYTEEDKKAFKEKTKAKNKKKYEREKIRMKENPKFCPNCGTTIYRTSKLCVKCTNNERSEQGFENLHNKGITREFLKNEIRTKSFTTIGKDHGVSDNAIRKWCQKYNLPYKPSEIKKLSDEEWELI